MSKKIKVAFAGLGGRGNCYAEHLAKMSDKVELVAAAEESRINGGAVVDVQAKMNK